MHEAAVLAKATFICCDGPACRLHRNGRSASNFTAEDRHLLPDSPVYLAQVVKEAPCLVLVFIVCCLPSRPPRCLLASWFVAWSAPAPTSATHGMQLNMSGSDKYLLSLHGRCSAIVTWVNDLHPFSLAGARKALSPCTVHSVHDRLNPNP